MPKGLMNIYTAAGSWGIASRGIEVEIGSFVLTGEMPITLLALFHRVKTFQIVVSVSSTMIIEITGIRILSAEVEPNAVSFD